MMGMNGKTKCIEGTTIRQVWLNRLVQVHGSSVSDLWRVCKLYGESLMVYFSALLH